MTEQNTKKETIIISLILGMALGIAKGWFVLSKTALKNRERINHLTPPIKIYNIFSGTFYVLILGMVALGVLLKTFNTYLGGYVVVASIYCGIGMALIAASYFYWETSPSKPTKETL